jgi:predicted transcriptional regulator
MRGRRTESGAREAEVLAALWAADRPLTPREVADAVGHGLAYNTVQTILTRLYEKGAVQRERVGRAHAYTPLLDEAGLAARRMHTVLDRSGDFATVVSRFVGTLDAEQRRILAHLLRTGRGDR